MSSHKNNSLRVWAWYKIFLVEEKQNYRIDKETSVCAIPIYTFILFSGIHIIDLKSFHH